MAHSLWHMGPEMTNIYYVDERTLFHQIYSNCDNRLGAFSRMVHFSVVWLVDSDVTTTSQKTHLLIVIMKRVRL